MIQIISINIFQKQLLNLFYFFSIYLSLHKSCCHVVSESVAGYSDINSIYNPDTPFSGFYIPKKVHGSFEQYAGAWFGSKDRVFATVRNIEEIKNLEGSSYAVVKYQDYRNLMSRDYFDFHITHVSASSNTVRSRLMPLYYNFTKNRLQKTIEILSKTKYREPDERLTQQTIAVIPFSARPGANQIVGDTYQQAIRILFFQVTFWSIHRYIPHIVVTVATQKDLDLLLQLDLPIWHVADLREKFNENFVGLEPGSTKFLPKESLLYLMANMIPTTILEMMNSTTLVPRNYEQFVRKSNIDFKYIYFTEADQILYMRHTKHIMDGLSEPTPMKSQLLIPHRMHNFILPNDAPDLLEMKFFVPFRKRMLDEATLEIENTEIAQGSCCDDGRFAFAPCKNGFWHFCKDWGLRNYTTWLKYGDSGMTFFAGSAHQAKCSYSAQRRVCEVPEGCFARTFKKDNARHFDRDCGEVSPPVYVGDFSKS